MCIRKIFHHHLCQHRITQLFQPCGNVECRTVVNEVAYTDKYPCIVQGCPYYGRTQSLMVSCSLLCIPARLLLLVYRIGSERANS